jgi:hypothetical protein
VSLVALIQAIFISCLIGAWWRGDAGRDRHARHERHPAKVVVAAPDDDGRVVVRSRHGHSHVKLGSRRHGLEVWSDDKGGSKVRLGGALHVETDEKGGSKVRLGDLVVESDGSD